MKTLTELQTEIGEWSRANFGENESQVVTLTGMLPCPTGLGLPTYVDVPLKLGSLAPLMGIVEELGELEEAQAYGEWDDKLDALGDIGVYLCDYAEREGVDLSEIAERMKSHTEVKARADARLLIHVGILYHATLKRHQGIRGFDDDVKYAFERDKAVANILNALYDYARIYLHEDNYIKILNDTWETVVKKRDWKTNKEAGVGE